MTDLATALRSAKAVFWDLDGTLIDSDPYWVQTERSVLEGHGGVWSEALAEALQGSSFPTTMRLLHEHGLDDELSDEVAVAQMTAEVLAMEQARMPWVAGVRELLTELAAAGIPSVLVTGSPRPIVDNVLAHAPAGSFVASISGDDPVEHKPSPQPYRAAARLAGVLPAVSPTAASDAAASDASVAAVGDAAEMRQCIIFEDSLPGLTAARAAGATVVAVSGQARVRVTDDPALRGLYDYTISDYRDIRLSDR
ncbi:HAD family phosphatase [Bifidobacterium jacchi]|uniref:HAD family phosphatase n=2 Tax=Bifidobacterium jacchi TaxID=2490545 RepID=A0A5N5RFK3_9BIFI|nr:HAD family phosphatase [Bifidobacterium jacchi]